MDEDKGDIDYLQLYTLIIDIKVIRSSNEDAFALNRLLTDHSD